MPQPDSTTTDPVVATPEEVGYEVGWAYEGCADDPETLTAQRAALQEMLDIYGDATVLWRSPPRIIPDHNHGATVGVTDFGASFIANNRACYWAVHGALQEKPSQGYVPEGVRLPIREVGA